MRHFLSVCLFQDFDLKEFARASGGAGMVGFTFRRVELSLNARDLAPNFANTVADQAIENDHMHYLGDESI